VPSGVTCGSNQVINVLGSWDAVTVELWNSRNRVPIDRPGQIEFFDDP